jgi:hypothetical protein
MARRYGHRWAELERGTEAGIDGRAYGAFYRTKEGAERTKGRWSPVARWVLMARWFLSIDPAPTEGEIEGAGPGEEAAAAWELGGGHWLSAAWQRPEIDGGGFGRGKEKREQAELGQTARREADRAAWVRWQVGRFREKVVEPGGAAMEIRPKWDLGCQRKIEIVLQISDSRKWDSNQKF